MRFAIFGSNSETRMPGTLVEIGLKLLLDLGSQVSTCIGPPSSQKRMTACALPFKPELVAAADESASPSESPRKPRDPAVTKLRRVTGCGIDPPYLMILREFTGTSQSPDKLAQSGFPIAPLGQ